MNKKAKKIMAWFMVGLMVASVAATIIAYVVS